MSTATRSPEPARPWRVLHFSQDFAPGKSQLGGFSRIYNTCRDGNAHHVLTISTDVERIEEHAIDPVRVTCFPVPRPAKHRADQLRLLRPLVAQIADYVAREQLQPDVLFGHSQLFNFFVLALLRRRCFPQLKLLWEANMIWGIDEGRGVKLRIANAVNRRLQGLVFDRADAIVFQTESARELVGERFRLPPDKCSVITNAVQLAPGNPPQARARRTGPLRVVCIGLFDELNGIPFLARMLDERPLEGVELTFIGDGKYRSEVERLHRANRCVYLGALPYSEMQRRFPDYDVLLIPRVPNIYADLFIPTKLLEAMSHGVVPVCSDVRAMRDVIDDRVNGMLFRAGDAAQLRDRLAELGRLPDDRLDQLAARARATVRESYDWNVNHLRLGQLYARLAAGPEVR